MPETTIDNKPGRKPLPPDFVGHLLSAAVDIHDRQVRRSERWTYLVPIWVALITGGLALVAALVGAALVAASGQGFFA
jgi:hypothetical protein